jgi:hypothetical protein
MTMTSNELNETKIVHILSKHRDEYGDVKGMKLKTLCGKLDIVFPRNVMEQQQMIRTIVSFKNVERSAKGTSDFQYLSNEEIEKREAERKAATEAKEKASNRIDAHVAAITTLLEMDPNFKPSYDLDLYPHMKPSRQGIFCVYKDRLNLQMIFNSSTGTIYLQISEKYTKSMAMDWGGVTLSVEDASKLVDTLESVQAFLDTLLGLGAKITKLR